MALCNISSANWISDSSVCPWMCSCWTWASVVAEVIVWSSAWHSFLCLPPPLSQMSDFVFLAICSYCAALPDRRRSGRLGSVNCKGMWHSFLKLRMFLWISGANFCRFHCGVWRKCFRTRVYSKLHSWLTATDCWTPTKCLFSPVSHQCILLLFFCPHLTTLNMLGWKGLIYHLKNK